MKGEKPYKLLNKYHINIAVSHNDIETYRLDMDAMLDDVRYAWAILIPLKEIRILQMFINSGIVAFRRTFRRKEKCLSG